MEEKKKIPPTTLSVSFTGARGQQKLVISVAAADGTLISGFIGRVQDGDVVTTFETGADGTAIHQANFTELSRQFEVRAGNKPELIWRGRLLGPKKSKNQLLRK